MEFSRRDRPLGLAPGSVRDWRELARRRLPRQFFDYIDGGAGEELTMRANEAALAAIGVRQRVLRDVSRRSTATRLFGEDLALPLVLAPVGLAGVYRRRGEVQAARAAAAFGVPFCESTVSICGVEEVARASSRAPWFQLYVMRDRAYAAELLARAAAAGASVLLLTVDLPVVGARYRDWRNGLEGRLSPLGRFRKLLDYAGHPSWAFDVGLLGKPLTFGNLEKAVPGATDPTAFKAWVDSQFDPSVSWDDLDWVRDNWKGKILLKGILDPEDAREAARRGLDGIVVSNHGGRQLDGAQATALALPAIAEALAGVAPPGFVILADGGVRSGTDILKYLALGAQACLIGRPWAWALAVGGEAGVGTILATMKAEMEVAMGLAGLNTVGEAGREILAFSRID
ncbi:MAG TPA: L-lactate dehydrogenase [Rectinemataceae bacterium]|nr:L-lactate dehydrogenase [Rectinemataceae bacterium]